MTELFRFTEKEPALREIDRRLVEAMRPQNQSGQLLNTLRAMAEKRKAGATTTPRGR